MNTTTLGARPIADTASGGPPRFRRGRRLLLGALATVAGLVIGMAWWLVGGAAVPWTPTDSSTIQESPAAPPPHVVASAANTAATAASQASLRMPIPEDAADERLAQLTRLMHARDELLQADQDIALRLDRIEAELADFRQLIEKRRTTHALAPKTPRTAPSSPPLMRVTRPTSQTLEPPSVLSVDTWNGRPSVSILVGADVRFIAEGDMVGNSYVKRADPASQRVDFVPTGRAAAAAVPTLGSER